jgi:subtilisin family serine protease
LVAVIDTGILADHPALDGAIAAGGYDFVDDDADPSEAANGQDDDGDGLIDEAAGHGTMVAGIIHLVAPRAKILPIRVLDDEGQGRTFTVAKAIRYAVEQGADVVNLSLGLTHSCFAIRHEVKLADSLSVAVAAAAGNLAAENPPYYPAVDTHVLSVAALDSSDVKADFSNWHERVAVSAPGVGVYAPYYDGEYAIGAGTSFASPFVAGQCALILALNPSLTVDEVYEFVGLGVEEIYSKPGNEQYLDKLGTGRVDGYQTWLNTPAATHIWDDAPASSAPLRVSPNPAVLRHGVVVRFDGWAARSALQASVYDAAGRLMQILPVDASGATRWDGIDRNGYRVPAGLYFIRLSGSHGSQSQGSGIRLVLLD